MWLWALVFVSDALVTWLAAKEQLALNRLSWSAVGWDGALALAIAVNVVGFTQAGWLMTIPSVLGSMTGMTGAIFYGRRAGGMRSGTSVRVEGFRAGISGHRGN